MYNFFYTGQSRKIQHKKIADFLL